MGFTQYLVNKQQSIAKLAECLSQLPHLETVVLETEPLIWSGDVANGLVRVAGKVTRRTVSEGVGLGAEALKSKGTSPDRRTPVFPR